MIRLAALLLTGALALVLPESEAAAGSSLLNASYDATRDFYADFNKVFAAAWKKQTGDDISVWMSHGGSNAQAQAVIYGLDADVVTLAIASDIDAIARTTGLIPQDWQTKLPDHASPYTSTVVFLVRKGNPKGIRDWSDLVRPGVSVITPNPKTSGGARWNFLAAWCYGLKTGGGGEASARQFVTQLYEHVPVLDNGAWGSMITFARHRQGDALIAWENEALLAQDEMKAAGVEIVVPSLSILAEPPVAVVEGNADRHDTRALAESYLKYLYSPEGQELAARHYFRPRRPAVARNYADRFASLELVSMAELGGWQSAEAKFFAEGGVFDQIRRAGR